MKRLTDEQKQEIIRLYPEHSARQVAKIMGISHQTVASFVKAQGLKHAEEVTKRLRDEVLRRARAAHSKETVDKINKAVKALRRQETLRLMSGQPQLSKLRVNLLPKKTQRRMSGLVYYFHYFRGNNRNECVLYYDEQTKRNSKVEEYATKRYGIVFKSAMEEPR